MIVLSASLHHAGDRCAQQTACGACREDAVARCVSFPPSAARDLRLAAAAETETPSSGPLPGLDIESFRQLCDKYAREHPETVEEAAVPFEGAPEPGSGV